MSKYSFREGTYRYSAAILQDAVAPPKGDEWKRIENKRRKSLGLSPLAIEPPPGSRIAKQRKSAANRKRRAALKAKATAEREEQKKEAKRNKMLAKSSGFGAKVRLPPLL